MEAVVNNLWLLDYSKKQREILQAFDAYNDLMDSIK